MSVGRMDGSLWHFDVWMLLNNRMNILDFELIRQSAERRRKEREERIKNRQICGTCKHWKLRIDKRVDNWDLPCAQKWGIIDPNDTCHCWKANEE